MQRRHRRDPEVRPDAPAPSPGAGDPALAAVLAAQRSAGNHAVARVLARESNPKMDQAPAAGPATGAQVDAVMDASAYFKQYVGAKIGKGARAGKGMVWDDEPAFAKAWLAYTAKKDDPKTGAPFTPVVAQRWLDEGMKGFEDAERGEIHIRKARADGGTPLHEALHFFSASAWKASAGYQLNEGVTEYFTRKLCTEAQVERDPASFRQPWHSIEVLAPIVTESVLGKAYFGGSTIDLMDPLDAAKGPGTFVKWLQLLEHGNRFREANGLLGAGPAPPLEIESPSKAGRRP